MIGNGGGFSLKFVQVSLVRSHTASSFDLVFEFFETFQKVNLLSDDEFEKACVIHGTII